VTAVVGSACTSGAFASVCSRLPAVLRYLPAPHDELLEAAHILPDGHPLVNRFIPNASRSASSTTPRSTRTSSA